MQDRDLPPLWDEKRLTHWNWVFSGQAYPSGRRWPCIAALGKRSKTCNMAQNSKGIDGIYIMIAIDVSVRELK